MLRAHGVDTATPMGVEKRAAAICVDADAMAAFGQGFQVAAAEPVAGQTQVRADVFLFSRSDRDVVRRRITGTAAAASGAFES